VSWIVLDPSVTLSWCFPDEQTPSAMGVLDLLKAGDQALVPAFCAPGFSIHCSSAGERANLGRQNTGFPRERFREAAPTLARAAGLAVICCSEGA
jgi:hypothetical protein